MTGRVGGEGKKAKLLFVVFIVLAIVIAGCAEIGGGKASGNGVEIRVFKTDLSTVNCNQQVNLNLQLQNTGSYDASVATQLFVIDPVSWGNPIQNPPNPFNLRAVMEQNVGAATQTVTWKLRPSCEMLDIPPSSSMTFDPRVRVFYTYKGDAKKAITFVSEEELRVLSSEGKSLPTGELISSSGPLKINIETVPFAQTFNTYFDVQIPVKIRITNVGGGKVPGTIDNEYPVAISISAPRGTSFVSCNNLNTVGAFNYNRIPFLSMPSPTFAGGGAFGDTREGYVSLSTDRGGQNVEVTCYLSVNDPSNIIKQKKYISVKIGYMYYIDTQPIQITVKNPAGQSF